jgi:hypothetical protein
MIRTMNVQTGSGGITMRDTYPEARSADREPLESQACSTILIPHRTR